MQATLDTLATSASVTAQIEAVVGAAPAALDTLGELSAALNNQSDYAATITVALAGKAAIVHEHEIANVTGLQTELDARSLVGHGHDASEISNLSIVATTNDYADLTNIPATFPPEAHNHTKSQITDLTTTDLDMGGRRVLFANVYATQAEFPSAATYHGGIAHSHADAALFYAHASQWVKLADAEHGHEIANVAGLQAALDGKQPAGNYAEQNHSHQLAELTDVSGDSPTTGQALTWGGTEWQPQNVPIGTTLNSLSGDLTIEVGSNLTLATDGTTFRFDSPVSADHGHVIADVDGLQAALDAKATASSLATVATTGNYSDLANIPSEFSPASHNQAIDTITGLQAALDGKQPVGDYAASVHQHGISDVTGLQGELDGKQPSGNYAATNHSHVAADITDLSAETVTRFQGIAGNVSLVAGANVEIAASGQNVTISTTGGGGGGDGVAGVSSINNLVGAVTVASGGGLSLAVSGSTLTLTAEEAGIQWVTPPPANSESTGTAGDVAYDENYFYLAVADNDWRRVAIEAWGVATTTITSQPSDANALLGDSVTFSVAATSSDGSTVSYQWQVSADGAVYNDISGATAASLTITPQQADSGNRYRASARATTGPAVLSSAALLTVTTESHRVTTESGDSLLTESNDFLRAEQTIDLPNLLTENDNRLTTEALEPLRI